MDKQFIPCVILDGDILRSGLNKDLGFKNDDRSENIRRAAETAKIINDSGIHVIVAMISPFKSDRRNAESVVGNERFIEVHVSTPLEICESRDPKNLYRLVRSGAIQNFTGISSPYEVPDAPDLIFDTSVVSLDIVSDSLFALMQG
jgi:adenylyl-sulfate kinase